MNEDERGHLYLLTGLIIGVVLGLAYSWWYQPVKYTDTAPASLQREFKDKYRALIAVAYLGNSDLVRARGRLELLKDDDVLRALSEQAQRTLAETGAASSPETAAEARALGLLAIALGQAQPGPAIAVTGIPVTPSTLAAPSQPGESETAPILVSGTPQNGPDTVPTSGPPTFTPEILPSSETPVVALVSATQTLDSRASSATGESPTPESTTLPAVPAGDVTTPAFQVPPSATLGPRATLTPTFTPAFTPTPGAPFLLLSQEKLCDVELPAPLIQIVALDRYNQPMSGIAVIVTWPGGEERFYTGLKPEKGPGYADFSPAPGVLYSLRLGENGQPEDNLAALVCIRAGGERYWGAWLLKFVQP